MFVQPRMEIVTKLTRKFVVYTGNYLMLTRKYVKLSCSHRKVADALLVVTNYPQFSVSIICVEMTIHKLHFMEPRRRHESLKKAHVAFGAP